MHADTKCAREPLDIAADASHVARAMAPSSKHHARPPWRPKARHVPALVVAFFASIVLLRPWLNSSSDVRVLAAAAWIAFVAIVTVVTAVRAVR